MGVPHLFLGVLNAILNPVALDAALLTIVNSVTGPRISVPRLAHTAGVNYQPLLAQRISLVFGKLNKRNFSALLPADEGQVGVADGAVASLQPFQGRQRRISL